MNPMSMWSRVSAKTIRRVPHYIHVMRHSLPYKSQPYRVRRRLPAIAGSLETLMRGIPVCDLHVHTLFLIYLSVGLNVQLTCSKLVVH